MGQFLITVPDTTTKESHKGALGKLQTHITANQPPHSFTPNSMSLNAAGVIQYFFLIVHEVRGNVIYINGKHCSQSLTMTQWQMTTS